MMSSIGDLTFKLHRPVIFNISKHSIRAKYHLHPSSSTHGTGKGVDVSKTPPARPPTVYGCVIGVQRGRVVEICDSFELLYNPVNRSFDRAFLKEQQKLYEEIYPNFYVLGWYSTGSDAEESYMSVHRALMMDTKKSRVFIFINPTTSCAQELPVTIYKSEPRVRDGITERIFVRVSYTIEMENAERILDDDVARLKPSNGGRAAILGAPEDADHKKRLHEFLQKRSMFLPTYHTINAGSKYAPTYRSTISIDGYSFTSDKFFQKKRAEKDAARIALSCLLQMTKDEGCCPIDEKQLKVMTKTMEMPEGQLLMIKEKEGGMTRTQRRRLQQKKRMQEFQLQICLENQPHMVSEQKKPEHDKPTSSSERTDGCKEAVSEPSKIECKFGGVANSALSAGSNMNQQRLPRELGATGMRFTPTEEENLSGDDKVKVEFRFIEKDVVEFEKLPFHIAKHVKSLTMMGRIDGQSANQILIDGGASVSLMTYKYFKKLGKTDDELIPSNMTLSSFTGVVSKVRGETKVNLTIGSRTSKTKLFVIDADVWYNLLLGRDWMHSNQCVPSTLHQTLAFWNGDRVEYIKANHDSNKLPVETAHQKPDMIENKSVIEPPEANDLACRGFTNRGFKWILKKIGLATYSMIFCIKKDKSLGDLS